MMNNLLLRINLFSLFYHCMHMAENPCQLHSNDSMYEMIYWNLPPYIFYNAEEGKVDGIFPSIFKGIETHCQKPLCGKQYAKFKYRAKNWKDFLDLFQSNVSYGEGQLSNISGTGGTIWGPIITNTAHDPKYLKQRGVKPPLFITSDKMVVVTQRSKISVLNKISNGLSQCYQLLIIAILYALNFGILFWLLERGVNNELDQSFVKGTCSAIWCSIITMTTVGYGDIVPRTLLAKILTVCWMCLGLSITFIVTGTITSVVMGVSYLDIYGQNVAVLKGSYEEIIVAQDYNCTVKAVENYEEIFMEVAKNNVFAAVLNADVAVYFQKLIENNQNLRRIYDISFIYTLPGRMRIDLFYSSLNNKKVTDCFNEKWADIYRRSAAYAFKPQLKLENILFDGFSNMFFERKSMQILLGVLFGLPFLGFAVEMLIKYMRGNTEQKEEENINQVIVAEMEKLKERMLKMIDINQSINDSKDA